MLERIPVDHLTGFFSRDQLKAFLQETILEAACVRKTVYVTLVDLDYFKKFNDRFGHVFGDEILKYAAEVMRSTLGEASNYFFRYGGDEFVIVSIDKKAREIVRALGKYNSNTYYQPFMSKKKSYRITLSAGIAAFPQDAQTVEELIKKADKAMYFSKAHGRKTITLSNITRYLVLRDAIFAALSAICVAILAIYILYNPLMLNDTFIYLKDQLKNIKIVNPVKGPAPLQPPAPVPARPLRDTVTMKGGKIYEGRILVSGAGEIIMRIDSPGGKMIRSLSRSDIEKVEYGLNTKDKDLADERPE